MRATAELRLAAIAPAAPNPLPAGAVIDAVVVDRGTAYVSGQVAFTGSDGASRALPDVLGDRGRHARSAAGVAGLPLGVPVEVEIVVKVDA